MYKGSKRKAKYVWDLSGIWMIPESDPFKVPSLTEEDLEKGPDVGNWTTKERERKEEWANFYSSKDFVKDSTTGLWMVALNEETCKVSQGFVCKVTLHNFENL